MEIRNWKYGEMPEFQEVKVISDDYLARQRYEAQLDIAVREQQAAIQARVKEHELRTQAEMEVWKNEQEHKRKIKRSYEMFIKYPLIALGAFTILTIWMKCLSVLILGGRF